VQALLARPPPIREKNRAARPDRAPLSLRRQNVVIRMKKNIHRTERLGLAGANKSVTLHSLDALVRSGALSVPRDECVRERRKSRLIRKPERILPSQPVGLSRRCARSREGSWWPYKAISSSFSVGTSRWRRKSRRNDFTGLWTKNESTSSSAKNFRSRTNFWSLSRPRHCTEPYRAPADDRAHPRA